jgi:carbon-monoxide dehydrogenase small subunit
VGIWLSSEETKTPDGKKGISRRRFIAVTATGVVAGAAIGVAGGYLGAPKGVTSTEVGTSTQTVTTTVTSGTQTGTQTGTQASSLLTFTVNGVAYSFNVGSNYGDVYYYDTLADTLREALGLTGTKQGCREGDCGACTVLANGTPILSCVTLSCECGGMDITTIEGLATGNTLHPIQQAFIDNFGTQCGFCTPGMILESKALLDQNPKATEAEIRTAISGNLCRCTGYVGIIKSILAAESTIGGT